MKEYIEERAVAVANYIIDYNATVRQTAKKFDISKSTVHTAVTKWTGSFWSWYKEKSAGMRDISHHISHSCFCL